MLLVLPFANVYVSVWSEKGDATIAKVTDKDSVGGGMPPWVMLLMGLVLCVLVLTGDHAYMHAYRDRRSRLHGQVVTRTCTLTAAGDYAYSYRWSCFHARFQGQVVTLTCTLTGAGNHAYMHAYMAGGHAYRSR